MTDTRGYNAASGLIDSNLIAGRGAKAAFIDPVRTLTFQELADETARMANLLAALAIPRETRIAVLMHDTCDLPVVFLGAIRAGVVPVLLNTLLTAEQYRYMLDDSRARAIVVSAALLPVLQPLFADMPSLTHVIVAGGEAPAYAFSLTRELARQSPAFHTVPTHSDETAFWLYSSGSTGAPKGVRHIHTSMRDTARHFAVDVLGLTDADVTFSAAKLFFAYGLGNGLSFPLSVGATSILLPERPTPESVFRTLKAHRPTVFFGVPTLYTAMLAHPDAGPSLGSDRLRMCVSAGEALPAEIGKTWAKLFGVDILDGVGSTEMLHIYVSNRPGDIAYGTSGKPVPGYRIRLVDDQDADVAIGEVGEMLIAGRTMAEGYWNQREKSRRTFMGEWMRSGDKYVADANGRYTYAGRTDDMFKVSGIWVSPFEVESALVTHPAVLEAAVVPGEDSDGLLKPKAFVVLKSGVAADPALAEALRLHVKDRAGAWKYPRWIQFVDALPKTATGKIQRFKLREA
jgi:4-hydroxybenzoate-CoA ligase